MQPMSPKTTRRQFFGTVVGGALATRLRKRKPELPVVLITGYSREVRHAVGSEMEVLAKPCGAHEIVDALSRAISARRPASPMH